MITREQAEALMYGETLHFTGQHPCRVEMGPRGGVREYITRVRVSGACRTWKRTPEKFRVPVKYGLYESSAIDEYNAGDFHRPEDCPAEG